MNEIPENRGTGNTFEKPQIRILSESELDEGVSLFGESISRQWPNSKEEAVAWVQEEWHRPDSVIFGAFNLDELVGTCSLIPLEYFLGQLNEEERNKVTKSLEEKGLGGKGLYFGGLAVKEAFEGRGIATELFFNAETVARQSGVSFLVGHTVKSTDAYPDIHSLPLALDKFGMKELLTHVEQGEDALELEKVWVYKEI